MKLTFRKKILFSYLAILVIFTLFLFPLSYSLIERVQARNLHREVDNLIEMVKVAKNEEELIATLKQKLPHLLFRVSLIDPTKGFLYDSQREISEERFQVEDRLDTPELIEAMTGKTGLDMRFSPLSDEKMAFFAVPFSFEDKQYVFRLGYPYPPLKNLTSDFVGTLFLFTSSILVLFGIFSWVIIHFLTRPIKQITAAITTYEREGGVLTIPEAGALGPDEEFGHLAATLNSLSRKTDEQMREVVSEKNEKAELLETLSEGVIAVDGMMTTIYLNRMAEEFLHIKKEALLGKSFILAELPACTHLIREAIESHKTQKMVLSPEEPKRYLDVFAVPRKGEGAICIFQDNTSLHRVIELERDFIANASHELKTPITIIRGFAETLNEHPELSREVTEEITGKIVSSCERMERLVKNLLVLASVDEGLPSLRLGEVDLFQLAEEAKKTVQVIHPDAKIMIDQRGQESCPFICHEDLLLQALINLVDNGIKYSKPPADIIIAAERRRHEVILQVSDKGAGIPASDLKRIFERFYSVDKAISRSMGGSGLGLSIVKGIVERHKGRIEVTSEVGKGSTFTMIFPVD